MVVQYAAGCIVTALGTPKMLAARHNVLQRALQRLDQLLNPGSPNPGKTWRLPWRKWDSQAPQTLLYKPNSWGSHTHAIFHFNLYLTSPKRWPHAPTTVCLLLDYFCIVLVRTWLPERPLAVPSCKFVEGFVWGNRVSPVRTSGQPMSCWSDIVSLCGGIRRSYVLYLSCNLLWALAKWFWLLSQNLVRSCFNQVSLWIGNWALFYFSVRNLKQEYVNFPKSTQGRHQFCKHD